MKKTTLLLLLFFSLAARAQHPYYYALNDENGLPSNEVYQVLQDSFGYMWIGCDAGLYRYDGFEYRQFRSSRQTGRSISGLSLDSKGRTWCRNFNGQLLLAENDSLTVIADFSGKPGGTSNYTLDDHDRAWMLADNRLYRFTDRGESSCAAVLPDSVQQNCISIVAWKSKIYFTTSVNHVYCYDTHSKSLRQITSPDGCTQTSKLTFFPAKDTLWLLQENMLHPSGSLFFLSGNRFPAPGIAIDLQDGKRIFNLCSDNSGKTWLCSSTGLTCLSWPGKTLFPQEKVSCLFCDKEGMYWISTLQDGIFIIPEPSVIRYDATNSTLPDADLTAVACNRERIVVGSHSGAVSIFKRKDGTVTTPATPAKSISTKKILLRGDTILVAHGPLSFFSGDRYDRNFSIYNTRDFCLVENAVCYLTPDHHGSKTVADLFSGQGDPYGKIHPGGGRAIVQTDDGQSVYYAFNNGLYLSKQGQMQEVLYNGRTIYANALSEYEGTVYAATLSFGLLEIREGIVVRAFNESNSIVANELKLVKSDSLFTWTCGNALLYRIPKNGGPVGSFSASSGINAKDINGIDTDGQTIYLATNKGLVYFPEQLQAKNEIAPSLRITALRRENHELALGNTIALSFGHSQLTIEYATVALKSKGAYSVYYRMVGLDSAWQKLPAASRQIIFSSIPSGEYVFEIFARNESGVPSAVTRIFIQSGYPVWQRWWFYLISSLLVIGAVVVLFNMRVRYIRKKSETEKRIISARLTALKAQMNPHFMYNALNSIQSLILKQDIRNSNLYLGKFSQLMRRVLDASGKEFITLQEEYDLLDLYLSLEKLRFGAEFEYTISLDPAIDTHHQLVPSVLLQPFVENAVKHGLLHKKGQKRLSIDFTAGKTMTCTITDNGIGRKKSSEIRGRLQGAHRSFSTQATEDRMELLSHYTRSRYVIEVIDLEEDGAAAGTKVVISFPQDPPGN